MAFWFGAKGTGLGLTGAASAACKYPGDVAGDGGALMTGWIYVDTSREVGDADDLKVFANEDGRGVVPRNDPEGVAFEYPVESNE
jgi:hypothetical protein